MHRPLFLGLLLAGLTLPTLACRYNVRDVGFVDLGAEPYHLFAFLPPDAPESHRTDLRAAADAALRESNIQFELVDTPTQPTHPALVHRPPSLSDDARHPFAVLVSPDGPALPVPLRAEGNSLANAARKAFADVATSPTREALVTAAMKSFGVMFLIEGTDVEANARARKVLADSIEQIRPHMATLPKAIAELPVIVTLAASELVRERVLLWTLRQTTEPQSEPRVVVVYGRARWLGPLIRLAELSTRNVVGLFSIIGADCECGMDLAWTQGTRLPVRWPESLHATLAQALGFDPENPLVKTEISSILARRGSTPKHEPERFDVPRATPPTASVPGQGAPAVTTTLPPVPKVPEPTPAPAPSSGLSWLVVGAGLVVLVVLGIGGWIALRGRG